MTASRIDPQEHVDAIYDLAALIQAEARILKECHTTESGDWGDDHNTKAAHAFMLERATHAEAAAEAFINLQTERDEILAALVALVEEAQPLGIDRKSYQTAIALVIKHVDDEEEACTDDIAAWAARRNAETAS